MTIPITIIEGGTARYWGGIKEFQDGSNISEDMIDKMIES